MINAIPQSSGVPGFLAPSPAFTFFEQAISGQLVNFHVFDAVGEGWYRFKRYEIEFYAPCWLDGYSEADVAKTPVMARTVHNEVLGVVW